MFYAHRNSCFCTRSNTYSYSVFRLGKHRMVLCPCKISYVTSDMV
uniref:Uncharacterized protein n=1 Tax=Arundo donax TaxID=35708 RepID=A0A0A8YF25_ARUDO